MNNKLLYESIMASVAKEVKKVLNETEERTKMDIEREAINYYNIPDAIKHGNRIHFDRMNQFEIVEFVKNINWNLIAEAFNLNEYVECDNGSVYGANLTIDIPCAVNTYLGLNVNFNWKQIPYISATRYQPAEGGYLKFKDFTINNIELIYDNKSYQIKNNSIKAIIKDTFKSVIEEIANDYMDENYENDYPDWDE